MRTVIACLLAALGAACFLPAQEAVAADSGVYAYGEWLSWKARRRDMDFVIIDPNDNGMVEGDRTSLNFDRDNGARIGLGYQTPTGWDLGMEYQTFRTSDALTFDAPAGGALWGTRLHPNSIIDDDDVTGTTASASLDYDVVDLTIGRRFMLDDRANVSMNLFGGFRYAMIDQAFDVQYRQDPQGRVVDITNPIKLDGYGLRLGGQLDWNLGGGVSIFGRAAGSVLAARVDSVYSDIENGANARVNMSETYYQTVPVIETALGVAYRRGPWEAAVGYELANWGNVGQRLDFDDDVDPQKHSLSSSDLLLDGFFFRIAFNR